MTELEPRVTLAMHSTHNSDYCLGVVNKLTLSTYQTEDEIGNGNDVVDDKDIVFFDVESTGLHVIRDRIIQIAMIKHFKNANPSKELTFLINPGIPESIPPG